MSKCRQCKIEIKDETHVCPLCHCVIEPEGDGKDTYPDVRIKTRRLMLAGRIYLFLTLAVSVFLIALNYEMYHGIWWSAIVAASLFYLYLVLRFAVLDDAGYRLKLMVLTICGVAMVILIDFVIGYRGWSVNYVIPSGILLIDLSIVILMLINHRNWQSYLLFQIGMIVLAGVTLILWGVGIITKPMLSLVTFAISVFLFLGTLIIGDRRARIELQRRFHVR